MRLPTCGLARRSQTRARVRISLAFVLAVASCGSPTTSHDDPITDAPSSTTTDASDPPPIDASIDAAPVSLAGVTCATAPPAGAPQPPPLPTYAGTCPTLVAGSNTIMSSNGPRRFILVVPAGYDPTTETLPLFFMWHHIGGDASSMVSNGMAQESADSMRVL